VETQTLLHFISPGTFQFLTSDSECCVCVFYVLFVYSSDSECDLLSLPLYVCVLL